MYKTAAGLALPFIKGNRSFSRLMVLATGAAPYVSHFNDIGFWMFKEYFIQGAANICFWTVMENLDWIMVFWGFNSEPYLFKFIIFTQSCLPQVSFR